MGLAMTRSRPHRPFKIPPSSVIKETLQSAFLRLLRVGSAVIEDRFKIGEERICTTAHQMRTSQSLAGEIGPKQKANLQTPWAFTWCGEIFVLVET